MSFANQVLPLLKDRCTVCHGGINNLFLDSYANLMKGGLGGTEVIPGNPNASPVILRIRGQVEPRMPFGGPYLSDDQINLIAAWIAQGAQNN